MSIRMESDAGDQVGAFVFVLSKAFDFDALTLSDLDDELVGWLNNLLPRNFPALQSIELGSGDNYIGDAVFRSFCGARYATRHLSEQAEIVQCSVDGHGDCPKSCGALDTERNLELILLPR